MPARKLYDDYFESGSTATKRAYSAPKKKVAPKPKKNTRAKTKIQPKAKKSNASIILFVLCAFAMTMFITYRYNIINEKNLKAQSLKKELEGAESTLVGSQIEVEQNTDLNKIESYAKQQLGMQKPDKNQTVYVDTSKTGQTVQVEQDTTVIEKIWNSIKSALENIF